MSGRKDGLTIFVVTVDELAASCFDAPINDLDSIKVVGRCVGANGAVEPIANCHPDVVVLQVKPPSPAGLRLIAQIKARLPSTRILVLSTDLNEYEMLTAIGIGADGYACRQITPWELATAVESLACGAAWLDKGISHMILKASVRSQTPERYPAALSKREMEVLRLLGQGLSNVQVAQRLAISIETVRFHTRQIIRKLAVSDRTQAIVKAIREGWV